MSEELHKVRLLLLKYTINPLFLLIFTELYSRVFFLLSIWTRGKYSPSNVFILRVCFAKINGPNLFRAYFTISSVWLLFYIQKFMSYCVFGNKTNTGTMDSRTWKKLVLDSGLLNKKYMNVRIHPVLFSGEDSFLFCFSRSLSLKIL